jgi:hypothetical protein
VVLKAGIFKRYKKLFIIDENGLRRIEGVMVQAASAYSEPLTITYRVQREDARFYETHNIDDVLTDPNVSERRINLLSIELRRTSGLNNLESHDLDPVVWVIFDKDDRPFQTSQVKVSISCPDKTWALMLADELEPQITRLFKVKKFPVWVISLLPLILTLIVYRTVILPFLTEVKSRVYAAINGGFPPLALCGRS